MVPLISTESALAVRLSADELLMWSMWSLQGRGAQVREGQGVEDPLRQRPVALRHPAGEL